MFGDKLAGIDPRLVKLLFDAVEALLRCERLTLTDLGAGSAARLRAEARHQMRGQVAGQSAD